MLYLDYDQVLADFDGHLQTYGVFKNDQTFHHTHPSTWTEEQTELSRRVKECMATPGFWETIPLCPGAYQLWDFCQVYRPTILTAIPSEKDWQERITYEKNQHIDKYFGFRIPRIICLRSEKQQYAKGIKDILLDDTVQNITEWVKAGGFGILHTDVENSIKKIRFAFEEVH